MFGSKTNIAAGYNHPLWSVYTLHFITILLFIGSLILKPFSKYRDIFYTICFITLALYNGLLLYLNKGAVIYVLPALLIPLTILGLVHTRREFLISFCLFIFINIGAFVTADGLSIANAPFILFLFIIICIILALIKFFVIKQGETLLEKKEELEKVNMQLALRNKKLGEYSYIASHHLRAPVRNIGILADFIEHDQKELSSLSKEHLNNIKKQVHRGLNIIDGVRMIADDLNLDIKQREVIYLKMLIDDIIERHHYLIEATPDRIENMVLPKHKILFVKGYLIKIFEILIKNAIVYKKKKRPLTLTIRSIEKEGFMMIKFEDNGKGIDLKKDGAKLFNVHERLHHYQEKSGMSLCSVKNMLEIFSGDISVESVLGKGSTFIVKIPIE